MVINCKFNKERMVGVDLFVGSDRYGNSVTGEMITYLGMTMPMAILL